MEPTEDCGSRIIPDNARVAFAGRGATDDKCRLCSLWCLLCWYARVGFVGRGAINDSVVLCLTWCHQCCYAFVSRGATSVRYARVALAGCRDDVVFSFYIISDLFVLNIYKNFFVFCLSRLQLCIVLERIQCYFVNLTDNFMTSPLLHSFRYNSAACHGRIEILILQLFSLP